MSMRLAQALLSDDPAERDRYLNEETLRHAVSRAIFCAVTQRVLDVRDAVLFTVTNNGSTGSITMTGAAWDSMSEGVLAKAAELGAVTEVIDGRAL
ncbi:hypothetical protein [Micromonospora sp. GCM10011541]|uniref:hypothetical protein n=1 Tax=Micromonospora sp. GCM10011541 TaxID=3317336 RepID=UPI00361C3C0A